MPSRTTARLRALLTVALTFGLAAPALAHVERPSFWPDPAPDTSVTPPAGGAVPTARSLLSALDSSDDSTTRVVCQDDSLQRARTSIARMRDDGYVLRPSQGTLTISAKRADRLLQINAALAGMCEYASIQDAVNDSGNNDRVVVMPGLYTEPKSRAVPTPDPACGQYRNDVTAGGAVSYRFHFYCPNDANLIAINGRALGPQSDQFGRGATPPVTDDRHGIPNEGACIRCNLQLEGSTDDPQDVVVEAGDASAGNGGPSAVGHAKDVGIKVDRADGTVIRNLTVRHAREHDIYLMESDGYLLDRIKTYYAGEYGVLTFGVDHGLMEDSSGAGHGDAVLYPGGSPDTGAQRDTSWYPAWRYNQELRRNDMYHSNLGYSGTMGNAIHVVDNDIYDNTTGIATESFYAGGHPGYPQDSATFEGNRIYSNNFNDYAPDSDVKVRTEVPIGTGIIIAGGNDNVVRNNQFWDNRRRAIMFVSVPTEFGCPIEGNNCTPKPSPTNQLSNSFDNHFYGNVMGIAPNGERKPNGVDFWWDEFAGTTGNCFYNNGAYTSDPPPSPVAGPVGPALPAGELREQRRHRQPGEGGRAARLRGRDRLPELHVVRAAAEARHDGPPSASRSARSGWPSPRPPGPAWPSTPTASTAGSSSPASPSSAARERGRPWPTRSPRWPTPHRRSRLQSTTCAQLAARRGRPPRSRSSAASPPRPRCPTPRTTARPSAPRRPRGCSTAPAPRPGRRPTCSTSSTTAPPPSPADPGRRGARRLTRTPASPARDGCRRPSPAACDHVAVFAGGNSIQLARIFGIRIGASPSWFFVLFALIYLLTGYFGDVVDVTNSERVRAGGRPPRCCSSPA